MASLTFTPAFSVSSLTSHATDRESTKAAVHSHLGLQEPISIASLLRAVFIQ